MPVRSIRDGALTIKSADLAPLTLVVAFVDGGLSWSERQRTVIHNNRGVLDHARKGVELPLEGSFSFRYQDADIRTALIDLLFPGLGLPAMTQTIDAGWVNPVTDATVKAGAILFGRTVRAGDVVGGSGTQGTSFPNPDAGLDILSGGPNLLFEIDDPATGSVAESLIFMAARITEYQFSEGEEFNQVTASFISGVKQPHIF